VSGVVVAERAYSAEMSQENVDIVRDYVVAWNASGEPDLSLYHPQLVYHTRSDEPDPSAHLGLAEYERLVRGFLESFSEITFELLELIDAGDYVIASTLLHARGSASGVDVTDRYVFVSRFQDGLVVEGWEFRTKQEALDALGLPE
jgi:ketosteroid isomerase-like protein